MMKWQFYTYPYVVPLAWLEEHTIDTYTLSRFAELDLWIIQMRERAVEGWQFIAMLISGSVWKEKKYIKQTELFHQK